MNQDKFTQELLRSVRQGELLSSGMRVLVACSGGLDSTVLAESLTQIAPLLNLTVELVHVDHRLRGAASEREALWVRVLGERLGLQTHALSLPEANAKGGQAEWRNLRRGLLEELAGIRQAGAIATAHHADDNAETFLMRSLAGTGSRGLSGIPTKDGLWVRPLLTFTRNEIEERARARGLAWVEDPSNDRGDYLRNRIRQEALPLLESLRTGAVKNLARAASRLEDEEREIDAWFSAQMRDKGAMMPLGWLERFPRALQRRALAVWLRERGVDYDPLLVETLLAGREVVHPAGSFLRRADSWVFSPDPEFGQVWEKPVELEFERRLDLGASMAWSFLPAAPGKLRSFSLALRLAFRDPRAAESANSWALDWNRTPWPLALRPHRPGETVVEKALADAGVPKPYRKAWPVLVSARNLDALVAIVGVGVLDEFKAIPGGRRVHVDHFFDERLNALSATC